MIDRQKALEVYDLQVIYYREDLKNVWKSLNKETKELIPEYKPETKKTPKRGSYRYKCWKITNVNACNIIGIEKRKFKEWDVDHIVPIKYGYNNNIPPELIGSLENLRMLPHRDNFRKGIKLTDESKELLKKWGYTE